MRFLDDKEAGIFWIKEEKKIETKEIRAELDSWTSPEIKEYIVSTIPVGKFIMWASDLATYKSYYGYIDGKLVATVVTSNDKRNLSLLGQHIAYTKNGLLYTDRKILSIPSAEMMLEGANFSEPWQKNEDKIEYLIINPDLQNRGFGTRVIMSIKNNRDFFMPKSSHNSLSTFINEDNIRSIRAFEHNGFRVLNLKNKSCGSFEDMYLDDAVLDC